MEPLYVKLYDKYTKLKAKKFGELEQHHKDQDEKFINYLTAAEELIQHLKDENESLHAKLNELIPSTRPSVDDQGLDYQKLLMEKIYKNKKLAEEVEKLLKLQNKGAGSIAEHADGERGQLNNHLSPQKGLDMSNGPTTTSRRTRSRPSDIDEGSNLRPLDNNGWEIVQENYENIFHKETTFTGEVVEAKQPPCCRKAGAELGDKSTCKCLFEALIQHALGIQFSVVTEVAEIRVSALHESSGYSFSLTWDDEKASGEVELMYTVQSLGTYERVAPEWMREVIKFSPSMCPVFFDRIARFVGLHH